MPRRVVSNELVVYQGSTMTLRLWCQKLNLNYLTVRMRYKRMVDPQDPHPRVDFSKLFAPTPVPKGAKNGQQNTDHSRVKAIAAATPPLWMNRLGYATRKALIEYVDFDTEKLEDLLVRLCGEFIEQHVLLSSNEKGREGLDRQTTYQTRAGEGLDIELQ